MRSATWRRLALSGRGRAGLGGAMLLLAVAVGGPLLASNKPIVCRFQGQWCFPGAVDALRRVPLVPLVLAPSRPFDMPGFDARAELANARLVLWPAIPIGPQETSADALAAPSRRHPLGTDDLGRDVLARMIAGTYVSMKVGLLSMAIALVLGVAVGGCAGYCGRWADGILSRVIEAATCFPTYFLLLTLAVWLEPGVHTIVLVIGLTRWTGIARYARAEFLRLRASAYVGAAVACGAGHLRIVLRHLLPASAAPILVVVSFGVAEAILIESALSWLGFGVPPPQSSWGSILRSGYEQMRVAPHLLYPPCVAIFVAVLVFNLLGDALRDALDPRTAVRIRRTVPAVAA